MFDLLRLGDWGDLPFFRDDLPGIAAALAQDPRDVLPPAEHTFAALERCPPDRTRVVILGQDPYPTPGHAHGLAFSAAAGTRPLPRSLANIFKEMKDDLGAAPEDCDLRFWADQGVLLLNTALTTPAGVPQGHAKLGWARLTRQVVARLADRPRAFLLWGRPAQSFAPQGAGHLVIATTHPSPLSARKGFFGSRPFSTVNRWLMERGDTPIDWTGAP